MKKFFNKENNIIFTLCFFIGVILLLGLNKTPNLWFDEAWSLIVAKNWVENGVYGRTLGGQFISAVGMAQPFSSTAWIALSYKLFGVGLWQARLPFVIFTSASIFFLFKIAYSLFGKRSAYLAIFAIIFLTNPEYQILWYGRQAIAEAPMVLYLLAGYYFFKQSPNNKMFLLGTTFFWGLAFNAKGHSFLFLSIGLLLPMIIAFYRKDWKIMRMFLSAFIGSLIVLLLLNGAEIFLVRGLETYGNLQDLLSTVAIVTSTAVHSWTLYYLFVFGFLSVISIFWESKSIWNGVQEIDEVGIIQYIRISLNGMLVSWLIWFAFFSIGWPRYYSPVFFLSCIYQGALLDQVIIFLSQVKTKFIHKSLYIFLFSLAGLFLMQFNIRSGHKLVQKGAYESQDLSEVIEYLEVQTEPEEIIETYDAEVIFLADNLSHYPPDNIQLELNRRTYLFEDVSIDYDISNNVHGYIVIGPISRIWNLYEPIIKQQRYLLVFENQSYEIYEYLGNGLNK